MTVLWNRLNHLCPERGREITADEYAYLVARAVLDPVRIVAEDLAVDVHDEIRDIVMYGPERGLLG